jgi:hypothetical protein
MANYKNIKGFNIQYLDSDPPNPIEGQMWFNSTTQTLKGAEAATIVDATWASGVALNTARSSTFAFGTTISTTTAVGGYSDDIGSDGTSWTETTDINTARYGLAGIGTSTSALAISGYISPITSYTTASESWNGTSWTTITSLSNPRYQGCGNANGASSTSALVFANIHPGSSGATEYWNGSSWTELNDMANLIASRSGSGSAISAMGIGGGPPTTGATEEWNVPDVLIKTFTTS